MRSLHDTNCPIKQYCRKKEIIHGSQGDYKTPARTEIHYTKISQDRKTKGAENKYKQYKNKLANIIKRCRKNYDSKMIDDCYKYC